MTRLKEIGRSALRSGAIASVTSSVALAVASLMERQGFFQPLNATSHWLHGEDAASVQRLDAAHTGVGIATHVAATVFWAALYEARLYQGWGDRPAEPVTTAPVIRDAIGVAIIACVIDYTITPKRFTPGWEFLLSKRAMAAGYAAMAGGMACSTLMFARTSSDRPLP